MILPQYSYWCVYIWAGQLMKFGFNKILATQDYKKTR